MATVHKGNRQIYLLGANQSPGVTTVHDKGVLTVIAVYNQKMVDIDKSDQHWAYYLVGHAKKKWWCCIFHSLINLCIVQAYIIWENSTRDPTSKKTTIAFSSVLTWQNSFMVVSPADSAKLVTGDLL